MYAKGMFSLLRFPIIFSFMKSKGANFACACLIALRNRCYKIFFPTRSHFPENGKTGFFCFLRVRDVASILKNVSYSISM